jgi:hypothetical protein
MSGDLFKAQLSFRAKPRTLDVKPRLSALLGAIRYRVRSRE